MPSVSKDQQRAAAIALAAKEGKIPVSRLKGASLQMYKSMTRQQLREFAETKRKGLPEKVASLEDLKNKLKDALAGGIEGMAGMGIPSLAISSIVEKAPLSLGRFGKYMGLTGGIGAILGLLGLKKSGLTSNPYEAQPGWAITNYKGKLISIKVSDPNAQQIILSNIPDDQKIKELERLGLLIYK
ncbi:MAG: DUF3008 family protein [Calditrichaeota bacterium]|nr:MAG: DUF3008 family protein [Calditrichota bacterium]